MTGTPSHSFWSGSKIRLRAVESDDAEFRMKWSEDAEAMRRGDRIQAPQSLASAKAWAEVHAKPREGTDDLTLVIETLDGIPVGLLSTEHCDPNNGVFGYSISIAREHWRKGYASEAIKILFRYYFEERRYQKAQTYVYAFNDPSIRLHESLGFIQEGCIRRSVYIAGQYYNKLMYGMTREEFEERHPDFGQGLPET